MILLEIFVLLIIIKRRSNNYQLGTLKKSNDIKVVLIQIINNDQNNLSDYR